MNLAVAGAAGVTFIVLIEQTTRLPVNGGAGWDGQQYIWMMTRDLEAGTGNTRLRPFVVLLNRGAWMVQTDPVAAFELMNIVYATALAYFVAAIYDGYGRSLPTKLFLVGCVAVSIATARLFAFYPVLVDLGALALISAAVHYSLGESTKKAGVAAVAAVASREFGLAAVALGVHRAVRRRVPARTIAATFGPALVTFIALRAWASRAPDQVSTTAMVANLGLWNDPQFAGFFLYFLLTVFGGVSVLIASRPAAAVRALRAEPEWITYSVLILAAAAVGNADIFRYLAFLVPVAAMLCARLEGSFGFAALACGVAITWFTQRPFERMDVVSYFGDWFPYYLVANRAPFRATVLWSDWAWRFIAVAVAVLLAGAFARYAEAPRPEADILRKTS